MSSSFVIVKYDCQAAAKSPERVPGVLVQINEEMSFKEVEDIARPLRWPNNKDKDKYGPAEEVQLEFWKFGRFLVGTGGTQSLNEIVMESLEGPDGCVHRPVLWYKLSSTCTKKTADGAT